MRSPCRSGMAHEITLLMWGHLPVAAERRGQARVAQVLGPRLHFLPSQIALAAERDDRVPEAVRVEVRHACPLERIAEHRADRAGALPVVFRQAVRLEVP